MRLPHLPVDGVYERGPNRGRAYTGHVATDRMGRIVAFPPGQHRFRDARVCDDAAELRALLSKGWKTRVDAGDGAPPSVLKAQARW
ncbi:hypothetical protein [Roseomonas sp. HF4]|uniref:hypothetical protein n=1 Tax=Roseomonas sp. HF4 TaxID=2562313 RepID=UPI0010C0E0D5|nr:hypothetical protein [Roseomonas sp. HF4]